MTFNIHSAKMLDSMQLHMSIAKRIGFAKRDLLGLGRKGLIILSKKLKNMEKAQYFCKWFGRSC